MTSAAHHILAAHHGRPAHKAVLHRLPLKGRALPLAPRLGRYPLEVPLPQDVPVHGTHHFRHTTSCARLQIFHLSPPLVMSLPHSLPLLPPPGLALQEA